MKSPRGKKATDVQEVTGEENKKKAIEIAVSHIQKRFGKGSLMRLGDKGGVVDIEVIPTGVLPVDIALGVGGIPRGRIVEVFGQESSGKTTLTLHIIASAQKDKGMAAFIDAEHALDPVYAKKLGVNVDDLLISQPDHGEQALEIVDALVRSGALDLIVIDSVAALVPEAEIEGKMGESHMGLQARLMSQALRKLTGNLNRTRTSIVFINQTRMKIGQTYGYGPAETTTGGNALKFYSTMRIEVKKGAQIKEGVDVIGNRTKIKVVKNKIAPPFKEVEVDLYYGEGFNREAILIELASEIDLIEKSGSWYSYNGESIGQGKDKARQFLKENPHIADEIEERIREEYGLKKAENVEAETEGGEAE